MKQSAGPRLPAEVIPRTALLTTLQTAEPDARVRMALAHGNVFIERYGLLDADDQDAIARGQTLWAMRPGREPVARPGRYLVIVDSETPARPAWAPAPTL